MATKRKMTQTQESKGIKKKNIKADPQTEKTEEKEGSRYGKLIVGALIIFFILGFFLLKENRINKNDQKQNIVVDVQPSGTPKATTSESPSGTQQVGSDNNKSAVVINDDTIPTPIVKRLPFTKAEPFKYILKQGDNLAKIGKIFCNDTRAYLYLAQLNNITESITLHPGDTITVKCK